MGSSWSKQTRAKTAGEICKYMYNCVLRIIVLNIQLKWKKKIHWSTFNLIFVTFINIKYHFCCCLTSEIFGKYLQRDIASLGINLSLKTVQLSPPIFGKFCKKKLIFCFSPKYTGLPVLTKYFVKKICLCPEEGLHFCYFKLTLGHFYTFNTWNSQKNISTKL